MPQISRAQFLGLAASVVPAALLQRDLFAQNRDRDAALPARVARVIETYDAQGIHRTATPVDNASGDWLRRMAEVAGAEARLVPFALDRVDVRAAYLDTGDRRIEGLPFFDGGFTGETGIVGQLGPQGSSADIALVTLDTAAISSEGRSIAALRRQPSLRAIVAVTAGGTPGLSPSNAESFGRPYGIPVLQVASEHQEFLTQAAASGRQIALVASVARTGDQGLNVVATLAGRQPDLAPFVVMTPRSGWWRCASERGGGLACWIEIVRAVSAARLARPVILLASSGHELGHFGLEAFLQSRPGLVTRAAAWMHLGANIGAANGRMRLQSSSDEIEGRALAALQEADASVQDRVPRGTLPGGEARNIHAGGGRYVSLLGSGPLFHNEKDRWRAAVDVDAVSRYAQATAALAVALARNV